MKSANSGARLATFRNHLGLTQEQAAFLFQVGKRTWVRYESGSQMPGGKVLARLTEAGLNPAWLTHGDDAGPMLRKHLKPSSVPQLSSSAAPIGHVDPDVAENPLLDHAHHANMAKLTLAKELVERIANELQFQPPSIIMGTLIGCVRLGRITEEGVRDVIKAVMTQAVLDSRSRI